MATKYETVIGLEIHAELSTDSKLFCNCKTTFGADSNTQTCPICLGMPGVLPVLNKRALEFAIKAALAMNCKIAQFSKFDRKNYFYPDLPKGYQISQYSLPLSYEGYLEYEFDGEIKRCGVTRVHLEEDAGKLVHEGVTNNPNISHVDFNRSCVPLIEIVGEPDLRSPAEAIAFWRAVKEVLEYLGVSDCNMEEGSYRCDANISLRPVGSEEYGTRTELKNQNSFRNVQAALEYEEKRQAKILDEGGEVIQETRLFDVEREVTRSMRQKEEAHDYRYFPEPDLVPIEVDERWVTEIHSTLPELPMYRRQRFVKEYQIPEYDASFLTATRQMADYYEECVKLSHDPKTCSNWIMVDLSSLLNDAGQSIEECKVTPKHLNDMIKMIKSGAISGKIGKTVLEEIFVSGKTPQQVVQEKGLIQISDESEIEDIIEQVITANPKPVQQYREGKKKVIGFLVGQVMKLTKGKANPRLVNKIFQEKLGG
ncbi:TPA: Asp-tRNA(Asn)/Glu-tRNA(Gln) amidotransferase subunit GatB [Candidatus Poribacteria bacterium]|nr:Asp-tRNA(Asn)/Glu-tRNA(Gln) amidotransferase subunit GatB [Candidatus Poribacteria bacterium]